MKTKTFSLIIASLLTVTAFCTNSCCTKKYCEDNMYGITFYNFDSTDVDTIIISKYSSGSNFSNFIDSNIYSGYKSILDTTYSVFLGTLNVEYDYLIKFPGISENYKITDFKLTRYPCNSCFPYTPKDEYHSSISEFKINGKITNRLEIYK